MSRVYNEDDVVLTVDVLIRVGEDKVLLIKRAKEPFMDKLVMPGGHVEASDKSAAYAASREVQEELSLHIGLMELEQLMLLDRVGRDSRPGRRISIVFTAQIGELAANSAIAKSDAESWEIVQLAKLDETMIGFDHWEAIDKLQEKLFDGV